MNSYNINKLNLDYKYVNDTKNMFQKRYYFDLTIPLQKMIEYIEESFQDVSNMLLHENIKLGERKEYLNMLRLMERKFKHVLQVVEVTNNLALIKDYDDYRTVANLLVAIFHDIGRFIEIHKVGTDMALEKVNHSELGLHYLFSGKDKFKDYVTPDLYREYYDALYNGIKYHGEYSVPYEKMPSFIEQTVKDIRDSDKVAIMESYIDPKTDMNTVFHMSFEELAKLPLSDATVKEFQNHQLVNFKAKNIPYDRLREFLAHISFIFDINSDVIYDYLYETNWITRYINQLKPYMEGENLKKLEAIEEIALEYLNFKRTNNSNAINLGYTEYQKTK